LCLYRAGPRPHIPFPPDLILYVNLVAKGAPKFFKTLAPQLTVLDIPYFADAYSRTVHPIDLHNFFFFFKANTQNPVSHDSAV
jgi:hypothetical protein